MWTVLVVGFMLGMRHAIEADHIAAVASMAGRERSMKRAVRLGAAWGVGHTLTLVTVVLLVQALGKEVPETLAQILEMIVGFMLMVLGADVLRRLLRDRIHFHTHDHGEEKHFHAHSHRDEGQHDDSPHDHEHKVHWKALAVGLVHGLAGSAALVVLTVAATDSLWLGLAYTILFGVGSILGMALLSMVIVVPLGIWERKLTRVYNFAMATIGFVTILVGGGLALESATGIGLIG